MEGDFTHQTPLGKPSEPVEGYSPSLLCPLPRQATRAELGLESDQLPFVGVDLWNLYELSWLNDSGKPQVALGQLEIPCDSSFLIESKSLKLYLNSFNQSRFTSTEAVARTIEADLLACLASPVIVRITPLSHVDSVAVSQMHGDCLDAIDVSADRYSPEPRLLRASQGPAVEECLYSNLFRSCCPVTGQPDWASVSIAYRGDRIDREGLLKYLISFRTHSGFHEQCVERIFVDILDRCRPAALTVYARFLRRGGIDINPLRTNCGALPDPQRLLRQ